MNKESILRQLCLIEKSIDRAKIPFEIDLMHDEVLKVSVYECMKAIQQLSNIVDEIKASRTLLNNDPNAQASVATDAASSNTADNQKQ